jgi:hypothetical protein
MPLSGQFLESAETPVWQVVAKLTNLRNLKNCGVVFGFPDKGRLLFTVNEAALTVFECLRFQCV